MIHHAPVIIYSKNFRELTELFLRLGFSSVDAGQGWLISALPPGERRAASVEISKKHDGVRLPESPLAAR
jgi:hypothetical protein